MHPHHDAQVGRETRAEGYSKVRPFSRPWCSVRYEHRVVHLKVEGHKLAACTIDDPPTGDFPGMGEGELQ